LVNWTDLRICNHPSQWLGDGAWKPQDSGKFARLREIAETVAAKQEKLLLFTQFRETTAPLAAYLGGVFGREGLVLHGGTRMAAGSRQAVHRPPRRRPEDRATAKPILSRSKSASELSSQAAEGSSSQRASSGSAIG
jgi:non-specific serine/threonine protein kinase